jgi:hypothetical protein
MPNQSVDSTRWAGAHLASHFDVLQKEMNRLAAHKEAILRLVNDAIDQIPEVRPSDLPPTELIPDVPEWHGFEHGLWRIGEEIRQVLNKEPKLRNDHELYSKFFEIARNRAGIRGRQSWVLLFAYKSCASWATELAKLLPDPDIDGHVILAIYKMKAPGFSGTILPYNHSGVAWIRKEAKRYLEFDHPQNRPAEEQNKSGEGTA